MYSGAKDVTIIGGGIVGLATALGLLQRLPGLRLTVLEKEPEVGTHQTGNNSGVVHAGIYYRPGSLKARLCVEGGRLLEAFCREHRLPYEACGKVIVATEAWEGPILADLYERGKANGVSDLQVIDGERLRELEPHAAGLQALHSPATAVVDFRQVAHAMADTLRRQGCEIRTASRVTAISSGPDGLILRTGRGTVTTRYLINCAGLQADLVARLAGDDPGVQIIPFRGEYYFLRRERRHLVRGLIYPVPDPRLPFLGIHLTRTVHGDVEAGPNAVLAFAREGYSALHLHPTELAATLTYPGLRALAKTYWRAGWSELRRSVSKGAFTAAAQRLVPDLRPGDLRRAGAGVRAQAVSADGRLLDDFHIVTGQRALHVLNAPSPAATASLAIGQHLAELAAARFHLAA